MILLIKGTFFDGLIECLSDCVLDTLIIVYVMVLQG
jgi:hypothetical protein